MEQEQITVVNPATLAWEQASSIEWGLARYRVLVHDPDTKLSIRIVRYPAGVMVPRHFHFGPEAMYVLDGQVVTWAGAHGPGSFLWFPKGTIMEHGASRDGDATVLLISGGAPQAHFVPH